MKLLTFRNKQYPEFISRGNHAKFIMPVAHEIIGSRQCGVDVGCKHVEWAFPGAVCVDITFEDGHHALNLPNSGKLEYIFSSHCLEHIEGWEKVIEYWYASLAKDGILFLYLPHTDNEYWDTRFMPTQRHKNNLNPQAVEYIMSKVGFNSVFCSQRDSAYSFSAYGIK